MNESNSAPNTAPNNTGVTDQTPTAEDSKSKQVILEGYLAKLYQQWTETHPNETPPIYLDKDGNPVWMNRKQRLARARQMRLNKK
jgi:hypothetical protein